jgi:hypothetical protein
MRRSGAVCLSLFVLFPSSEASRLVDVTAESGIDFVHASGDPEKRTILSSVGGGAALFDYDLDTDLDLYLVRNGANELYRNEGGFRFDEVAEEAGLSQRGRSIGCAAADYDNDGLPDLYVTRIGRDALYRNRGDGSFEDVTEAWGIRAEGFSASAAFFDAEGDGDLDLYVARYVEPDQEFPAPGSEPTCLWLGLPVMCGPRGLRGEPDIYYRNEGRAFVDATAESGLTDSIRAYGLGVVSSDYDSDGDPDLYIANDTNPNFLYRNDGGGHFEEAGLLSGAGYDGKGATQAGMGVDAGDANGDGLPDLFVTNFSHETNTLYLGSKEGLFTDATSEAGLATPSLGPLGWGTRFTDLDNDGDEDLFVANGHVYPNVSDVDQTTSYRETNQVFLNDGTGTFVEAGSFGRARSHRGAAFGDLDEDGDADVVVVAMDEATTVLRNDWPQGRHFVGLELHGRASNRDAAGTRVSLSAGARRQGKEAHASGSIFSSSDRRLLFGLGSAERADQIRIRWPSGQETILEAVPADRYLIVVEGIEGSLEPAAGTPTPPQARSSARSSILRTRRFPARRRSRRVGPVTRL